MTECRDYRESGGDILEIPEIISESRTGPYMQGLSYNFSPGGGTPD